MNALVFIGVFLIVGVTSQYVKPHINPLYDPNCEYSNGRIIHDPIHHDPRFLQRGFDHGIRNRLDISVRGALDGAFPTRRWKRSLYNRNRLLPSIGQFGYDRFDNGRTYDPGYGRNHQRGHGSPRYDSERYIDLLFKGRNRGGNRY